jgi:hypothetical protein
MERGLRHQVHIEVGVFGDVLTKGNHSENDRARRDGVREERRIGYSQEELHYLTTYGPNDEMISTNAVTFVQRKGVMWVDAGRKR